MSNKVIFSTGAEKELQISFNWYEDQKVGLGERFLSVIDHAVSSIGKNPEFYPVKINSYRQYVVAKFPYVIVYEFIADQEIIYILHIFNVHQNPAKKLAP